MKNRNNDRSDASLQGDHHGDVQGSLSKSPFSHQGDYHKKGIHIHLDRAPWLVIKTHSSWCIIKKNLKKPLVLPLQSDKGLPAVDALRYSGFRSPSSLYERCS
jgi:hypothetical protein